MKLYTYEVEYQVSGHVSACDLDDAHAEANQAKEVLEKVYGASKVEFKIKETGQ